VKRVYDASAHPDGYRTTGSICARQVRAARGSRGRDLRPAAVLIWNAARTGDEMAKPDAVFIDIGTYPSEAAAQADYDIIKNLHAAGVIGTYRAP
jgi:hypothetical protein